MNLMVSEERLERPGIDIIGPLLESNSQLPLLFSSQCFCLFNILQLHLKVFCLNIELQFCWTVYDLHNAIHHTVTMTMTNAELVIQ